MTNPQPTIVIIGQNPVKLWGLSGERRIARIAEANGLRVVTEAGGARLLANPAFAFDPSWLRHIARTPATMLTSGGVPVLAHVGSDAEAAAVAGAMAADSPLSLPDVTGLAAEAGVSLFNEQLRKREQPFVDRLRPANIAALEKASYVGAYKGVTDLLTKYLWPQWAFWLTRIAAAFGLSPNMVTGIGFLFCVAAGIAFYEGHYWWGLASGLVSMVLDTVDGKLARCTITSSWWGNVFDHGIDLIHPPIWWWAWAMGLAAYGTPIGSFALWTALAVIMVAYVVQRLIEGAFIAAFGMHIHVWERADSQFRLITARRNPNWLILLAAMVAGRPDLGLLALAWWAGLSCLFHVVRLGQAYWVRARGKPILSWLEGA